MSIDMAAVTAFMEQNPQARAAAVSEQFNISRSSADALLREIGVIRPRSRLNPDDKDQMVREFLEVSIATHGWAPSVREIGDGTGLGPNVAWSTLRRLAEQGLIEIGPYPRQIRLARMKAATEQL